MAGVKIFAPPWKERILHGGAKKIKFISSSRRVMFFLLYRQKDIDKIIEGNNYRNYLIDKLTCEIMENKPLRSRMLFLWILRVVYFPVKHSCLYNNILYIFPLITNPYSADTSLLKAHMDTKIYSIWVISIVKNFSKRTPDWTDNSSIGLLPWNTYCSWLIKINQCI